MQVEAIVSQKRRGTVLFADVADFTKFAEQIGAEGAFELIQAVSGKMQEAVRSQNGTIGEFRGDGIMALFSVTAGIEDGPLRACRAALQIQAFLRAMQDEMQARHGRAPQVRVGIHSGPLVVGDVGDQNKAHVTIIGDTANVAARLEAMAGHGEIYISSDLFALVEGRVEATDLGERDMKGKSAPQRVFLLQGVKDGVSRFDASVSRGLSALTEREGELAHLDAVYAGLPSTGIGIVNIGGEAGIGKSRLLYEFEQRLTGRGATILKGECRPDAMTVPFMPFAEMLRHVLSADDTTSATKLEERLADLLRTLDFEIEANLPYLLTLLGRKSEAATEWGLSAEMIGERTRGVIVAIIARLAARSSVVLVVEDLHWADPATLQIVDRLSGLDQMIPLMIICTNRPEFVPSWSGHPRTTTITPGPLSTEGVAALIRQRLSGAGDALAMADLVIEKADGNPLYAEEIVKLLVQRRQSEGAATGDESAVVLPTNLQNMVMERFDRLPKECRKLLQAAAVMGRRFDGQLAAGIVAAQAQFEPAQLEEATRAELVLPFGGSGMEYQFKHALVQDAIRDTLLQGQRRHLHERIGAELEARFADRLEEASESLAHHFTQAEIPDKAATYLIAAGVRNLKLFSLSVANDAFATAHRLIDRHGLNLDEDHVAELFASWFEVQQWRAEFGKTVALFESQPDRMRAIAGNRRYARILGLVGIAYCQNLQFDLSRQRHDEAIAIGERNGDRDAIVYGCLGLMALECSAPGPGFFARTGDLADRIDRLLGDEAQPYYRTYCNFYRNWSHSIRGDMDTARDSGHGLIEMGRRTNFTGAVGWGAICVAFNEAYCENYGTAIAFATIGEQAAGGQVDKLVCQGLKGFSMVMNGDVSSGARILDDIRACREELDYLGVDNIVDGPIGLARFLGGDMAGGVRWLEDTIARALANGNTHSAAMSHISLGTIHLMLATAKGKPDLSLLRRNILFLMGTLPFAKSRAVAHFDKAVALGREIGMAGVEAQALCGKGMALSAAKRPDAARAALTEARQAVSGIRWSMMQDRIEAVLKEMG